MPNHFREEVNGFPDPTLARMLAELDQRLMPFQSRAAARAEIKNLMQGKKIGLREFSRVVRSLGGVANNNMGAQTRDDMNREQFIDGIFDAELQKLFLGESLKVSTRQWLVPSFWNWLTKLPERGAEDDRTIFRSWRLYQTGCLERSETV